MGRDSVNRCLRLRHAGNALQVGVEAEVFVAAFNQQSRDRLALPLADLKQKVTARRQVLYSLRDEAAVDREAVRASVERGGGLVVPHLWLQYLGARNVRGI